MFVDILRGIIKQETLFKQYLRQHVRFRTFGFDIRINATTIIHYPARGSFKRSLQGVGNRSYTSVVPAMPVVQYLNATASGRIIFGRSNLELGIIRQRSTYLYQPLSIRFLAYYNSAIVILQRTG